MSRVFLSRNERGTFRHPGTQHRTAGNWHSARHEGEDRARALLEAATSSGSVGQYCAKSYGSADEHCDTIWANLNHGCRKLRRQLRACFDWRGCW